MRDSPISVRLSRAVKGRLAEAAQRNGRSLHAEIVGRLERSVGGEERAARIVAAAVADFVPEEPAAKRKRRERTEMCEHRIPVGAWCYKGCDG